MQGRNKIETFKNVYFCHLDLPTVTESNLQETLCELQEKLKSKITEIKTKHKEQIIALGRSKLKKKSGNHHDEEKDISTEIPS